MNISWYLYLDFTTLNMPSFVWLVSIKNIGTCDSAQVCPVIDCLKQRQFFVLALGFACEDCFCSLKKRINQHEDQGAVFGRKVGHSEAEKEGKIYQSDCTSIGHSQNNNLECPAKEENHWCINHKSSNWSAEENSSRSLGELWQ